MFLTRWWKKKEKPQAPIPPPTYAEHELPSKYRPITLSLVHKKLDGTKAIDQIFFNKEAYYGNDQVFLLFERNTPRALAISRRTFESAKWTWERVGDRRYVVESFEALLPTLPVDF